MRVFAALLTAACLLGCGGGKPDGPKLAPVTGTVTRKGTPLAEVNVTFLPATGPAATGKTGSDGKFELMTNGKPGAVLGQHKVGVTEAAIPPMPGTVDPKSIPKAAFPAKYGDPAQSGIEITVAEGGAPVEVKLLE